MGFLFCGVYKSVTDTHTWFFILWGLQICGNGSGRFVEQRKVLLNNGRFVEQTAAALLTHTQCAWQAHSYTHMVFFILWGLQICGNGSGRFVEQRKVLLNNGRRFVEQRPPLC